METRGAGSPLPVLMVGNPQRREFREAAETIGRTADLRIAATLADGETLLAEGGFTPAVLVLAQAYPGQFAADGVDRLRSLAPLARVVGLLGSWCEGEMRTGFPWPAAIRLYWHQWEPRWENEMRRLRAGVASSWALPVTASEEERGLCQAECRAAAPPRYGGGLVVVAAAGLEMYELLAAACRYRGLATARIRPDRCAASLAFDGAAAALFDASDFSSSEEAVLGRLTECLRPAPALVLLDFPRVEDGDRARAAGAAAILSKPFSLDELDWHLDRLLSVSAR